MGSTSSKFKKYLQHGDEFAAMQIYQGSPELRKNLDPNLSYGESHNHNTALHYAAKHGMKHLLRTFINDLNGNPNKKNGSNETVLHCACQLNPTKSFGAQERRAACVQLILYWKGVPLASGGREKVDLIAQDKDGNTALHYAALTGLKRCVELLLSHGSPLFTENEDKLTPCDVAMRASNHDIARLLESRMVFAENPDIINEDELILEKEIYSGLRSQDLQEAKDQLLVDTSDMLKIPLFTAEALLRDNEWSREVLLEKWMKNPVDCCLLAGVQAPPSALYQGGSIDSNTSNENNEEFTSFRPDVLCEICYLTVPNNEQTTIMSCKHVFCKTCWESYLTTKIQDGDAHHILCPAYQCHILVPVELIEKIVSPEMARRYLQFDIKAFVDSNRSIKWCPIPGCGRAVRLPEIEQSKQLNNNKCIPVTSHAVDCGNAHFFCWECLGEAHAPSGCRQWQEWQMKIAEVKPEELQASCSGSEDAANFLWLVTNSKPCPNCKSPIQKNEGCNHMKCSKCKFDFCWVCQESWKRHSSATGGYFRCNRFEAVGKADERQGSMISDAVDRNNQMQEISRFLHFYTRFRNHENSQKLEEPLLVNVHQKMEVLANSLLGNSQKNDSNDNSTKFIEDGVRELLKARRILCGSYVYGFYIEDDGYNKSIFEFMQNELEEVTEKLSEMIARPYLRTPKTVIVQTTLLARRKRHEFVKAVAQGLIPPETPQIQRKARKRRYLDMELSPSDTWLRDCEWPQYDSDNEENEPTVMKHHSHSLNSPKAHECSLRCSKHGCGKAVSDCNMELMIALEMSRLQMIEDRMKQAQTNAITPDPSSSISNNSNESNDDQLKLAIQLSLQENTRQDGNFHRSCAYEKTSADLTVDYFLKSLANHKIDLRSLEVSSGGVGCSRFLTSGGTGAITDNFWIRSERDGLFKSCRGKEDGRFQISDIHENGYAFRRVDEMEENDYRLKRSHSTGDLCSKRFGRDHRNIAKLYTIPADEPRYHLDSDHSSQHDDRPEDTGRRMLALPDGESPIDVGANSGRKKQFPLLQHSYPEEGQSSVEDTTTSDSINADMEVCGILESLTDEDIGSKVYNDEECKMYVNLTKKTDNISTPSKSSTESVLRKTQNPFATLKAKICSTQLAKPSGYLSKISVNKNLGFLSSAVTAGGSTHKIEFEERKQKQGEGTTEKQKSKSDKAKLCRRTSHYEEDHLGNDLREREKRFSKSTGFLEKAEHPSYKFLAKNEGKHPSANLRIKLCKSPDPKYNKTRVLETDSSNEYESETGIPKSPTLFISGVSISRTPEPKSPGISLMSSSAGRQSRSSSLSVPVTLGTCSLNISTNSLNNNIIPSTVHNNNYPPEPYTPSLIRSTTPLMSRNHLSTPPTASPSKSTNGASLSGAANKENTHHSGSSTSNPSTSTVTALSTSSTSTSSTTSKSKSANEPEREREMFRFPKSSTDGALSSVLHVQESNLSSDDFHEALFLLERSPKQRDSSKRRKKSKKKDSSKNTATEDSKKEKDKEEVTSAL